MPTDEDAALLSPEDRERLTDLLERLDDGTCGVGAALLTVSNMLTKARADGWEDCAAVVRSGKTNARGRTLYPPLPPNPYGPGTPRGEAAGVWLTPDEVAAMEDTPLPMDLGDAVCTVCGSPVAAGGKPCGHNP